MLAALTAALIATSPGPLLFDGGAKGWVVMSRAGELLESRQLLAGLKARDAAVSPDRKTWAFISDDRLYVWNVDAKSPREVPRAGDVLETPTFSPDGRWVYFIQNDFQTMRLPGEPMRYSQVWRVGVGGGKPQKLTKTAGCHMWPVPLATGDTLFTHATCYGGRSVDLLSKRTASEKLLLGNDVDHGEAAIDSTGARAAVLREHRGEQTLVELDLATGVGEQRALLPFRSMRLRPGWDAADEAVWLQDSEAVWKVSADGQLTKHIDFASLKDAR